MLKHSEKRLYAWLENPLTPRYLLSTLPSCPAPPTLPSPRGKRGPWGLRVKPEFSQ